MHRAPLLTAIAVAVVACAPAAPPPSASPSGAPSTAAAAPTPFAIAASPAGPDSPVVVAIEGAGLFTLDASGAKPLYATKNVLRALAVAKDGAVFASFYEEGTVIVDAAGARPLTPMRFKEILPIDGKHGFAITDDIEWEVVRFDGEAMTTEKNRRDFVGKFDDNKFDDAAIDGRGELWITCWNGLYRRGDGAWTAVQRPEGERAPDGLVVVGGTLFGDFASTCFAREPDGWRKAECPDAAAKRASKETPFDLAVDARGRSWIVSDISLTVFDARGAEVARWPLGTLRGADGPVTAIAIAGNGLGRLPAPAIPGAWEVSGAFEFYKNRTPHAGAQVRICRGRGTCDPDEAILTTTTAADGSFSFSGVTDGVYSVAAAIPEGLDLCQSPFTLHGGALLTTPKGCDAITRRCDLGKMAVCMPFEMPPPR